MGVLDKHSRYYAFITVVSESIWSWNVSLLVEWKKEIADSDSADNANCLWEQSC